MTQAEAVPSRVASAVFGRPYRAWLDHGLEEPITQAIKATYFVLFHHEFFHHMVESLGIRVESMTERPAYVSYADSVYKVAKGPPNLVEEALANSFAYRAAEQPAFASFLSRKPHAGAQMQDGCLQYLRERFPKDPPGYNRALEFVSNEGFDAGLSLLVAQIRQTNVKPIGNIRFNSILATELDPIFGEDNVRCVEVPDAWNHRILRD